MSAVMCLINLFDMWETFGTLRNSSENQFVLKPLVLILTNRIEPKLHVHHLSDECNFPYSL